MKEFKVKYIGVEKESFPFEFTPGEIYPAVTDGNMCLFVMDDVSSKFNLNKEIKYHINYYCMSKKQEKLFEIVE